jgi:hypothetical protein
MGLGGSGRAHLGRGAPTRPLSAAGRSGLPAPRHSISTRHRPRLPGAPDLPLAGFHIARHKPKPGGEIERVDAKLRPEAGLPEKISSAVAAILPNRRRAAQRHQVALARGRSSATVALSPDLRAFRGRRFAAGGTGQGLDEAFMPGENANLGQLRDGPAIWAGSLMRALPRADGRRRWI